MIPEKENQRQQTDNPDGKGAHYEWRLAVSDALRDSGYEADADAFWSCASDQAIYFIPHTKILPEDTDTRSLYVCATQRSHRVKAVRETCHLRICPDCAKRASARLLARYMPKCREMLESHHPRYRFRKIVLTTDIHLCSPRIEEEYRKLRQAVNKVFEALLPRNWRDDHGYIVSDEFGPEGLKLHFHVVFWGGWIENRDGHDITLSKAWKAATGGRGVVTWINAVPSEDVENELVEALKYATKFWKQNPDGSIVRLPPELVVILHEVLTGIRRVRSYGIFYNLPEPADRDLVCPDCQSPVVRLSVSEWNVFARTGWLPDEQSLYLRLGNKSPPTGGDESNSGPSLCKESGSECPKAAQPVLVGMPQSNTSFDFEG